MFDVTNLALISDAFWITIIGGKVYKNDSEQYIQTIISVNKRNECSL